MQKYLNVANYFDVGAGTVYSSKDSSNSILTVAISSAIFNGTNYYNGRWKSTWTVKFGPGKKADIEGSVRICVHYYEEGNVQLNTNITKKKQGLAATNPDILAEAVIKYIGEVEAEFQNQLDINYEKMGNTTFKALRRQLPLTGTKVNWSKIGQYKIGSELDKKK